MFCWNIVGPSLLLLMIIMIGLMRLFPAGGKWETVPLYIRVLSVLW